MWCWGWVGVRGGGADEERGLGVDLEEIRGAEGSREDSVGWGRVWSEVGRRSMGVVKWGGERSMGFELWVWGRIECRSDMP